jgi:hypothetical protein
VRTLTRQVHFQDGLLQRPQRLVKHGERPNLEVLKQRATCNFEEAFVATRHVKFIVGTKVVFQKPGGNNADGETENENPC